MSESSSDTESSCGWTVISNEGSDIENMGPEIGVDYDPVEAAGASAPGQPVSSPAENVEVEEQSSLDVTVKEDETILEAEPGQEVGKEAGLDDQAHLCSFSDHSDIVTLGDSKEAELGVWEEPVARADEDAGNEELYMGTSSSSQYSFSAAETICPARRGSSSTSTEDEDGGETKTSPGVVRRRRLRKNTAGSDPDEHKDGDEGREVEEIVESEEHKVARTQHLRQNSGTLNRCILLALVVAISMGFGHFYGTVQIQERQRLVEKSLMNDIIYTGAFESLEDDLEKKKDMGISLTSTMDKITKENQNLRAREVELQAQKQDLLMQLQRAKSEMDSRQKHHASENQLLKSTLEREEASGLALMDELRRLRAQILKLEQKGAGADSVLSENQRLKDHLVEEKQRIQSYLSQREALMAEAQVLRKELDNERKVTDALRKEIEEMSQRDPGMQGEEGEADTEELQTRLQELEKKLSFEQQRSDLWERLYVESKEDRAKGDSQPKTRKSKEGMFGKVKETFDAVKNSTKEFVHQHKEQIKKAKEAVKENLRKFSDSVKSTFRHLKDSTSNVLDRIRRRQDKRYNERKDTKTERQEFQQEPFPEQESKRSAEEHGRHIRPLHQHPRKSTVDSFNADCNVRKPGPHKQQRTSGRKTAPKGCTGVFDCAYQESMSLFNKAMEPIRADEFHQLLRSYLQQEVGHFHHWRELESFINSFFQNGLFIHDQMLFTDFVSGVENYLVDMDEYHGDLFEDLDDFVYKHFFGETYSEQYAQNGPSRPYEGPGSKVKPEQDCNHHQHHHHHHHQQRKHQHSRPSVPRDRKWARSGRNSDRHFTEVKIELGPMPFDPKY